MIKVSIIVPVYNTEKYLEKCLTSLINQTLKDIEIICINDGSQDTSFKILNQFTKRDNRIVVIDKKNEGQSIARNIGIKQAKGEFLGFVDSDDWVDLDYFEKLYNAAKNNSCAMACAGFKRCKVHSQPIRLKFKKEEIVCDIDKKVKINNMPKFSYIWNKIYDRKTFIENDILFPKHRYFEDVAVLIKILYFMGNLITVPDTYYNYRKNLTSTVFQRSKKHTEDLKLAKEELYNFAKEHNIYILYKKFDIMFLDLVILKIYEFSDESSLYKLFGFLPLFRKIVR